MGINQKFRELQEAGESANQEAKQANRNAQVALLHLHGLVQRLGLEGVQEPAGEGKIRIRYRRRLPKWLTWLRRVR